MTKEANQKFIGKSGLLSVEGLQVPVEIIDHRAQFGRDDLLVRPVGGKGEKWVSAERVSLSK